MTAARREDLIVEVDTTLDSSGNYVGDWIDSGGIDRIRLVSYPYAFVIESADQITGLGAIDPISFGSGEARLTCRYFRINVSVGSTYANAAFHATVRAIPFPN